MAEVAFHVEGHKDLARILKRIDKEYAKELKEIHREVAQPILAKVRPPRRSGRLAGTLRAAPTAQQARVALGTKRVPYAGPIHWGWLRRNIQPNKFLVDALHASSEASLNVYRRETDRFLDRVWATT